MNQLDAIETINFEPLAAATDRLLPHRGRIPQHRPDTDQPSPDRTVIVRPRGRHFDATTIFVSSVVSGLFLAFATFAALA
jgi:hypothetical protein